MPDKKARSNRIPIRYPDSEEESEISSRSNNEDFAEAQDEQDDPLDEGGSVLPATDEEAGATLPFGDDAGLFPNVQRGSGELGGPLVAELVATRAELKRVEGEMAEMKDRLARLAALSPAPGSVAEIAAKLLPVLDNLKRALDTEASMEAGESDEFRHFLSGVDLIFKQLSGVIEALGVKPVLAVGERFDPHIHEAVVSEATDELEPDTVMEEIIRGYRMGDKLIRPALVKVAIKK